MEDQDKRAEEQDDVEAHGVSLNVNEDVAEEADDDEDDVEAHALRHRPQSL